MENSIDYLRLSLTDRCNLNCIYCKPVDRSRLLDRRDILTHEEMVRVVALFVKLGIRKLRLTGGESLIKKNITGLVAKFKAIEGLEEIAITTNGVHLSGLAYSLKKAGVDRLNISIDTLKKERYKTITGFDYYDRVWAGIQKAIVSGFDPVKLNVILIKGLNDDEVNDFARLVFIYPLIVRFIEFFPTNKRSAELAGLSVENEAVKGRIEQDFGKMKRAFDVRGSGPAEYYRLSGSKGRIGFISSYTRDFCDACNRVRMDCAGRIYPCLFSGSTHDVKSFLRGRKDDDALISYMEEVFKIKSKFKRNRQMCRQVEMSSIGG